MTPRASNKNSHSQPLLKSKGQRCIVRYPTQQEFSERNVSFWEHRASYACKPGLTRVCVGMMRELQPGAGV